MGKDILAVATAIVTGAILISLFQAPGTSDVVGALTGGFAQIIGAMTGSPVGAAPAVANALGVPANTGVALGSPSSPAQGAHL